MIPPDIKRIQEKVDVFMNIAVVLSQLSCCKVKKHGAIIVPGDFSAILAIGYNGPSCGMPNDICTGADNSQCGCVHAEANALAKLKATQRGAGFIMMCTKSPCLECAKLIANSGAITFVSYQAEWSRMRESIGILSSAGIGWCNVGSLSITLAMQAGQQTMKMMKDMMCLTSPMDDFKVGPVGPGGRI